MGTRSNIGILFEDGHVESIYCHWDGYIEHVGKILLNNYKTIDKIKELLNYGNISSIEMDGYPDPYEPKEEFVIYKDINKMMENKQEYLYLFLEKEKYWIVVYNYENYISYKLEDELNKPHGRI